MLASLAPGSTSNSETNRQTDRQIKAMLLISCAWPGEMPKGFCPFSTLPGEACPGLQTTAGLAMTTAGLAMSDDKDLAVTSRSTLTSYQRERLSTG